MIRTTLIIPDIHHKWEQAEKIISAVGADDIIFLGDYLDDFNDTSEMVMNTAEWLVDSLNKPNRIHLYGNHDQSYALGFRALRCSGYEQWKDFIISDIVSKSDWNKLKWYHFLDNRWLLTHAGLHTRCVPAHIQELHTNRQAFIKALGSYLDNEIIEGYRHSANNEAYWSLNAGNVRGGQCQLGGIVWCDFNMEFKPIRGIGQIVGHTPQRHGEPKWCILDESHKKPAFISYSKHIPSVVHFDDPESSVNLDLDVMGNLHYAIWNGEQLTIGNYKDL